MSDKPKKPVKRLKYKFEPVYGNMLDYSECVGYDKAIDEYEAWHNATRLTEEEIRGAIARGYCTRTNSKKELDADLCNAIAKAILEAQKEKEDA